jgi:type VI secretion system protein ImpI
MRTPRENHHAFASLPRMPVAVVARVFDTQANQSFDAVFERFPVRIGRNALNDLHIDRPYVSQFHASVELRDDRILVKDHGSTNGTLHAGQRLARETPIDVSGTPEIHIGPVVIRLGIVEAAKKPRDGQRGVLDDASGAVPAVLSRRPPITPGAEDPYVRQAVPYIEAYRAAWGSVYRLVYESVGRLPAELRANYLARLGLEHPAVGTESDFQKLAAYYGVDAGTLGEPAPPQAALAALNELAQQLAPGQKPLADIPSVLAFGRRLRDSMEVFLKCFVSLRDGYQEFEAEVLARERTSQGDRVTTARDAKELGVVLLGEGGGPEAARQLHEIFVDVMSHQVALLNGVMEGVRSLLTQLAPKTLEDELDKRGKKTGLFSNKYEALWKLYEVRHGDYSGEDKETFLIIFGPQFSRAYAASAGEDYSSSGGPPNKAGRFTLAGSQNKR